MSSEFSCDYCSAMPRNPCYSSTEALECPNLSMSSRACYLEMKASDVALWLRSNMYGLTELEIEVMEAACRIIEEKY